MALIDNINPVYLKCMASGPGNESFFLPDIPELASITVTFYINMISINKKKIAIYHVLYI